MSFMKHQYFNSYLVKSKKSDIDKTKELFNLIDITVIENMDYRKVLDLAIDYKYGAHKDEYLQRDLNAIMVNNIRHRCSNYDDIVSKVNKIKRTNSDYIQYKNSILDKIAIIYPYLQQECTRQKRRLDMVEIHKTG